MRSCTILTKCSSRQFSQTLLVWKIFSKRPLFLLVYSQFPLSLTCASECHFAGAVTATPESGWFDLKRREGGKKERREGGREGGREGRSEGGREGGGGERDRGR